MNLWVDLVRSTARSRRNLHFGGIMGPDRPQKRYKNLDGVAEIRFYTELRVLGRFCGRFGGKMDSFCRSRRDLAFGLTRKFKKRLKK